MLCRELLMNSCSTKMKRAEASKNEYANKARAYCARQERCIVDVRKKLSDWRTPAEFVNGIISDLLAEKFIDEERYAVIFARGKFRMNKWGRIRIKRALKAKGVKQDLIEKGIVEIDEKAYRDTLIRLLQKKKESLPDSYGHTGRNKLIRYALSRGFEQHLVLEVMQHQAMQ